MFYFQAHRGGIEHFAENSLEAILDAWKYIEAIPEVDVRISKDNVYVCHHDSSLIHPLKGECEISSLRYDELLKCDISSPHYPKTPIARFEGVLQEMAKNEKRWLYVDLKEGDVDTLKKMFVTYKVHNRIIMVHHSIEFLRLCEGYKTMTWCEGTTQEIISRYTRLESEHFEGVSQIQFHLYSELRGKTLALSLDSSFLHHALKSTQDYNVDLQIRVFPELHSPTLAYLKEIGIRWYESAYPYLFTKLMHSLGSQSIPKEIVLL